MKSWSEFIHEQPELAQIGRRLLFRTRPHIGLVFIATLRKDGAPRLHPVSLVINNNHLYVLIPSTSPKCSDLKRDGRYAAQAFPQPENEENEEFYFAGCAEWIRDADIRQALIAATNIQVEEREVLFELYLDRAMHTRLINQGTPDERPVHRKWNANRPAN